jgi:malate dehydrogenase
MPPPPPVLPRRPLTGACPGGIGQPLSLLLKCSPLIDELSLYDIVNSPGVAVDLSHINTKSNVSGYLPPDDGMAKSLRGADIVIIPAGVPRKVLMPNL